ncbi:hypothetical protein [Vibrio cholerae]|uniref:hypothetical protein n=1 Tax=Vibrio cholerae TaxID=666 RepID=UPI002895B214|nr:hypothetical protein [Vibrio cholerae]EKN8282039.1 hypothetical protein [Vibrio cholerae]MDT3741615.1 hypothetical protein [Vibrio cholerae]
MSFESRILCVFEGESREPKFFNSLKRVFFEDSDIYFCCYGNDIYELFEKISDDDDLNIFDLIRENNTVLSNVKLFEKYTVDDFSQVFLFFDFECNDEKFNAEKLKRMLEKFSDETLHGKLFISYPMIESIRDIPENIAFYQHKVSVEHCVGKCYKPLSVHKNAYQDPRKITPKLWKDLVSLSVEKANFMIYSELGNYSLVEQTDIFNSQINLMNDSKQIYVLCAFPMFVHHQKGESLELYSI